MVCTIFTVDAVLVLMCDCCFNQSNAILFVATKYSQQSMLYLQAYMIIIKSESAIILRVYIQTTTEV